MVEYCNIKQLPCLFYFLCQCLILVAWLQIARRMIMAQYYAACKMVEGTFKYQACIGNGTGNATLAYLLSAYNFVGTVQIHYPKLFTAQIGQVVKVFIYIFTACNLFFLFYFC